MGGSQIFGENVVDLYKAVIRMSVCGPKWLYSGVRISQCGPCFALFCEFLYQSKCCHVFLFQPPSPVDVHAQSYAGLKRENDSLQAQLDAMKANMNELKETWDVARNLLASEKNRFKSQSGDAQKEIAELKAKIKVLLA